MSKTVLILLLGLWFCNSYAQRELWGTTDYGGANDFGNIFKTDSTGNNIQNIHTFEKISGYYPNSHLIEASNGNLYGTAGRYLYEYNPNTKTYKDIYYFALTSNGYSPGELIEASNGKLYGLMWNGGAYTFYGVLYEFDLTTFSFTKLYDFNGSSSGGNPTGELIEIGNELYGVTNRGGSLNKGVLFKFNYTTNSYAKLLDFGIDIDGESPLNGLTQWTNGKLYGTTTNGGINNVGIIYEYDIVLDTCIKKYDFQSSTGSSPQTELLIDSTNICYGMTNAGGTNNKGTIFRFDLNSLFYTVLHNFDGLNGSNPMGDLVQLNDGSLVGTTNSGGVTNDGVLFSFNPTASTYNLLHNLSGVDGSRPFKGFNLANDGKIYSVAFYGGVSNKGTLFNYDFSSNSFTKIIDFDYAINGYYPLSGLTKVDTLIFGMTSRGGDFDKGTIFKINPVTNKLTKVFDFDGPQGAEPQCQLTFSTNGLLYGMTYKGGTSDKGTLFSFDPQTNIYIKKLDFTGSNGSYPFGDLLEASNGKLYGSASVLVFEYDKVLDSVTQSINISGYCKGGLTEASNGLIYGIKGDNQLSGGNNISYIFEYNPTLNSYTNKVTLPTNFGGTYCFGKLINRGNVFNAMAYKMGSFTQGAVFSYNPGSTGINTLFVFGGYGGLEGCYPKGNLLYTSSNEVFGMTTQCGANGRGILFELLGSSINKTHDFLDADGEFPRYGSLIEYCSPPKAFFSKDTIINICSGNVLNIPLNSSNTINYTWKKNGIILPLQNEDSLFISTVTPLDSGTYTCEMKNVCGTTISKSIIVNVDPSFTTFDTIIICQNDSVFLEGNYQNTSGDYADTLNTICSSDSIVNTTLIVNPTYQTNLNFSICNDDSLFLGGSYQYYPGTYYDTLQTQLGCDSVISSQLSYINIPITSQNITICQGDSIFLQGEYQTTNGLYFDTLQSNLGCDSTIANNLSIITPVYSSVQYVEICANDSVLIGSSYQNTSGIYYDTLLTYINCDSIIPIALSVNNLPSVYFANFNPDTTCQSDLPFSLPYTFPAGGTYSGNGVTALNFDPSIAGIGTHNIIYTYTDSNLCTNSDTSTINVINCVGINEIFSDSDILIFPNPCKGWFTIEKPDGFSKQINIKLFDINHKLLTEKEMNYDSQKSKIDITSYSKGTYFLHLTIGNKVYIKQLVKE